MYPHIVTTLNYFCFRSKETLQFINSYDQIVNPFAQITFRTINEDKKGVISSSKSDCKCRQVSPSFKLIAPVTTR